MKSICVNYVIFIKKFTTFIPFASPTFIFRKVSLQQIIMKRNEVGFMSVKKAKFRQLFPEITYKDLRFREGQERQMLEMLGAKLGKTTKELLFIIIGL